MKKYKIHPKTLYAFYEATVFTLDALGDENNKQMIPRRLGLFAKVDMQDHDIYSLPLLERVLFLLTGEETKLEISEEAPWHGCYMEFLTEKLEGEG